ncbi:MAG: ribonuclease III [Pegethrix bostrychoides GSE-TBD4-15B]|jgi:ribonuclease-3|uniref:Ribonuclease 3 n=1 Tax=Pegethrix bostrychoides GSE-TBD4-15B TaxID=2839662 RepID=A0A951PDQ7_9CYAN|nr:ribonuclease III [Pegethrix bostrychoides GSE-TBD4-15B]
MLDPRRQTQLQQLIQDLKLPAMPSVNWRLLDRALVHPTAAADNYERLEFVGDAVVRLAAAEFLYQVEPAAPEGEMAAIRSILVSDRTLAEIADCYELERYLVMSASVAASSVGRETRLAAAFEAMLAALYLSAQDLCLIRPWLDPHWQQYAITIRQDPTLQNYKGALQGLTQGKYQSLPDYRITEVGQTYGDSERFLAEVWVKDRCWGKGKGQSKKAAEQAAAQVAFQALQAEIHGVE